MPYALISSETGDTGLITGYYEPIIDGSRVPTAQHRFPIFGVPPDLVIVDLGMSSPKPGRSGCAAASRPAPRPYYSRAEIDARGEAFGAPVLAWSGDPVELFFLQIQGSGQVRWRTASASASATPTRTATLPLARPLPRRSRRALLEQASMQGIKAWAAANPQKLRDALNHNASYVFFRELPPTDGPIGALGVPLHAERASRSTGASSRSARRCTWRARFRCRKSRSSA